MTDDPHYAAHARRIQMLQRLAPVPLSDYYAGYRAGMVRWLAAGQGDLPRTDHAARAWRRLATRALAGREPDREQAAFGCGYHDGVQWQGVTRHRGLLRLGVDLHGGSVREFARHVWDVDEGSVRQMLGNRRPIPPDRYAALLDFVQGPPAGAG